MTLSTVDADRGDRHPDRIAQQLSRQLADLGRHGRREEQALALGWKLRDDAADRRQEAQVQHLIGLVEHQNLGAGKRDMALGEVVDETARRGNQHVDAARERLNLGPVAHAAEHDRHAQAEMPAVGAEAFGNLGGQLAGGREHQDAATLALCRTAVGRQALNDRQGERRGLAGARLGNAEKVAAGQDDRDGFGLDRRRRHVAFALQCLEDRRGEAEIGKHRQLRILSCGRAHIGCANIRAQAERGQFL